MIFRRSRTIRRMLILMPVFLFFASAIQILGISEFIKKTGEDPRAFFSPATLGIFSLIWFIISLAPILFYFRIIRRQYITLADDAISLTDRKKTQTIRFREIGEVCINMEKGRPGLIVVFSEQGRMLIGDFEGKREMIDAISGKIHTSLIHYIE